MVAAGGIEEQSRSNILDVVDCCQNEFIRCGTVYVVLLDVLYFMQENYLQKWYL